LRLFLAVDAGEHFRSELDLRLDAWRRQLRIAWVRPENWHLTLQFLGSWPAQLLSPLQEALLDEARRHAGFMVRPGALGAFPNLRAPRVLFLQFESGGALEQLAAGVRARVSAVAPAGPQDEKPFRAHLTVARVKRPLPAHLRVVFQEMDLGSWNPLPVRDFRLVQSELRPEGARYTVCTVCPLATAPSGESAP
jgi:2'-5' RNA ligase